MRNNSKKLALIFLLVLLSVIYIIIPYPADKLSSSSYSKINNYISSKMKELRIPGASLGIVHGDEIYVNGYGKADANTLVKADTPFLLGSTTKSLTAFAIMQLVEQEKIDLDEKVITYLPNFRFNNSSESDKITVRQLLNQTSGISGSTGGSDYLNDKSTRKDFIKELLNTKLSDTPGNSYEYAEANYVILGEIITAVSGQSYEDYMKEHIFIPLNMEHSYTNKTDAANNGLANGHITWFGYPIQTELPYPMQYASASALYSSAEDLTHYINLYINKGNYNDKSLLSYPNMKELIHPSVSLKHPDGYSYGMGWFVNQKLIMHNGSPINYYSIILIDTESKNGVVFLANVNNRLITGDYIMQLTYEIMHQLTGVPAGTGGIGFRQLYKILHVLIFWMIILLLYRILKTFFTWPKKIKSKKLTVKQYIKSLLTDAVFFIAASCLFLILLTCYRVSIRIAYLGQPDIVLSLCIIIALPVLNIIAKICLFTNLPFHR